MCRREVLEEPEGYTDCGGAENAVDQHIETASYWLDARWLATFISSAGSIAETGVPSSKHHNSIGKSPGASVWAGHGVEWTDLTPPPPDAESTDSPQSDLKKLILAQDTF
ncbi:uncharacterized protein B0T23DRAFT_450731 [Neurospora hispaniola]|uniref:Uncharacterized protein n=1 Tax=Neurospora hispaniola TaxID=588809 RepID=A0AAJ0IH38_9PEZI|nr:hypothetical protein B0T23DRAFT_450731 [Neurospora hispaniola]